MLQTIRSHRGMVSAPHHLAARAGLRVLEEGGNAIEAMVAAASTIAVVYPHMNALGSDNFWLIHEPGRDPILGSGDPGADRRSKPSVRARRCPQNAHAHSVDEENGQRRRTLTA